LIQLTFILIFISLIKCITNIENTKIWTWEYVLSSHDHWFGRVIFIITIKFTINAFMLAETVDQLRLVSKSRISAVGFDSSIASSRNYWWVIPSCSGEPRE
jgi:hypothetical protein